MGKQSSTVLKLCLAVICCLSLSAAFSACGQQAPSATATDSIDTSSPLSQNKIAETSPLFAYWQQQFPGSQWQALAQGDINNDGKPDLVIVYGTEGTKCSVLAVLDTPKGYQLTPAIDAPVEQQVIRIFNMNDAPPLEISVTGQRGDNIGYAIFNIVNGNMKLIMATGYGDCC